MDGVLVRERSSWRIVHGVLGTSNEEAYELYMQGKIDDREFMRRDIALWRGADPGLSVADIGRMFSGVERTEGYLDALLAFKKAGFDLILISGGLDLLFSMIDKEGLFRKAYANGLMADQDGRLTGEGIMRVPLRDKGGVLRKFLDECDGYDRTVAVGDSHVDVTMFDLCDLSIAFRPMDGTARERADIVIEEEDLRAVSRAVLQGS